MILKQTPEDFQVEELTDVQPGEGPFALYRLEKRGWTTPDALLAIRRRWKIDRQRLSFGGLKDRHAHTTQHFTIYRGPARKMTHQGFTVAYLGQMAAPFASEMISANRFGLVLRRLTPDEMAKAQTSLEEVRSDGVPNYFDDQRFGSVARGSAFFGKCVLEGQYEAALRLALTSPYEHDRGPQKKEKAFLRSHWGDWNACTQALKSGDAHRIVQHLADHAGDARGAIACLRPELRTLYLSAYQSHLWNRMLAAWLRTNLREEQLVPVALRLGAAPMHRNLDEEQRSALRDVMLPLPSPKAILDEGDPRKALLDAVLAEEHLTLDHFKLKDCKGMFFSRGERAAWCMPRELTWDTGIDEIHAGFLSLRLRFTLPRGAYATLLVKRLT